MMKEWDRMDAPHDEEKKKYADLFVEEFMKALAGKGQLKKAAQDALDACMDIKEGKTGAYEKLVKTIDADEGLRMHAMKVAESLASGNAPYARQMLRNVAVKRIKKLLKRIEPEIYKNPLATSIYSNLFLVENKLGEEGLRKAIPYILRHIRIPKVKSEIKDELEGLAICEMPLVTVAGPAMTGNEKDGKKDTNAARLDFSDVGGMHEIKKMLELEIISPLRSPALARKYNKRMSGGYLLYGPPGCGKSFLAEAVAGEGKINFMRANISDILNMYVGNSEKNLSAVFEEARNAQPALVFFDEIEALGGSRENLDQHWQKTLVNVFLQEMDRIEKNEERIVVFGATNTPWELDIALKRSGRFGKEVFVGPPDTESRKEILNIYSKNLPLGDVDLDALASLTGGFSAANLKSVCEKAVTRAWKDAVNGNERRITMADFMEAARAEKSDTAEWMSLAERYGLAGKKDREKMYR